MSALTLEKGPLQEVKLPWFTMSHLNMFSCLVDWRKTRLGTVKEAPTPTKCVLDDLWGFDGQQWTHKLDNADEAPAGRSGAAMAYDGDRGVVTLFGGYVEIAAEDTDSEISATDTWELDGSDWTQVARLDLKFSQW